MSQEQINTIQTIKPRQITQAIVESVASRHNVDPVAVFGDCRKRAVMLARRESMVEVHAARPHWSYPKIGMEFGGKDHTSVIHALRMAGVYQPQSTRKARAAYVVGKFIQQYEAIADMHEHRMTCRLADALARLFGPKPEKIVKRRLRAPEGGAQ